MKSNAAFRRPGHLYFRPIRNTSEAIHIKRVYDDGLFCIGENRYSVSYAFQDINYTSLSKEDRENHKQKEKQHILHQGQIHICEEG